MRPGQDEDLAHVPEPEPRLGRPTEGKGTINRLLRPYIEGRAKLPLPDSVEPTQEAVWTADWLPVERVLPTSTRDSDLRGDSPADW